MLDKSGDETSKKYKAELEGECFFSGYRPGASRGGLLPAPRGVLWLAAERAGADL